MKILSDFVGWQFSKGKLPSLPLSSSCMRGVETSQVRRNFVIGSQHRGGDRHLSELGHSDRPGGLEINGRTDESVRSQSEGSRDSYVTVPRTKT